MNAVLQAREPSAKYLANAAVQTPLPLVQQFDLLATAPGGVARLRELILTLAVQGKLVPQDPSDEPASVLLQKIRAEKDRLIAAGKIKRDKPLGEIAEEDILYELPQGWEWARLPEIYYSISPSGNKLLSSAVLPEGKYPVVDQGQRHIAGYTNDGSILIIIPGPVIVFGDHTKEIKYIDFDFVAGADGTKILRPVLQDEIFFTWQLRSFSLEDRGYARHFKVLNAKMFAVPPLAEQSRIVTRVEELMRLCDALESQRKLETAQHARLLSTLLGTLTDSTSADELAANWQRVSDHFDLLLDRPEAVDALEQTILQLAVRGLLVPQDPDDEPAGVLLQKIRAEKDRLIAAGKIKRDKALPAIANEEKPFEPPMGWQLVRLIDLIRIGSGDGLTAAQMTAGGAIPVYGGNGVTGFHDQSNVNEKTIVIGRVGYYCGSVHITPDEAWITDNAFITRYPRDLLDMQWLYWLLRGTNLKEKDAATAQPVISGRKLYPIVVALPPLAEQTRIVARVNQLRSLCADLRQRLSARQATQSHLAEALVEV
jgi:type I restriction enzyme S subunit